MPKITPYLWFNDNAEEAANFYIAIFKNSEITDISRFPDGVPGRVAGSVMEVTFRLDGQEFMGLNGGPGFTFSEAFSLVVHCKDQAEVDYYWDRLLADGGQPSACGWLKDRFGFSWQILPDALGGLIGGPDPAAAQRATEAMLQMSKLDLAAIQRAYDGA